MKLLSISIVEILSPTATPRSPASGGARRRRSSASTLTSPDSPCDLTIVSRPDSGRPLRRCICYEILSSCLCKELTRTRDGVCDMCLYGIHVEEEGEREFDLPHVLYRKRLRVD